MAKYQVVGHLLTQVIVYVEADDVEDARALGSELLKSGEGIHGEPVWQDEEFDVYEEVELG